MGVRDGVETVGDFVGAGTEGEFEGYCVAVGMNVVGGVGAKEGDEIVGLEVGILDVGEPDGANVVGGSVGVNVGINVI